MQPSTSTFNSQSSAQATRPMTSPQSFTSGQLQPVDDMVEYITTYARQNPGTAALWCFGLGFIIGWKLKPW